MNNLTKDEERTLALLGEIETYQQALKEGYSSYFFRMIEKKHRELQKHLLAMDKKVKKELEFKAVNKQANLF